MVMSFVRRAALTSLAPLLLLGACAEDKPDPPAAEPTSSPPSATASAAEPSASAEPTLPPEAEGTGPEAAEAFVRHYFATMDHARLTQDTTALEALALETCKSCEGVVRVIQRTARNDGSITGGDQTVLNIDLAPVDNSSTDLTGRATLGSTEQVIKGSGDPAVDGTYPAGELRMAIRVSRIEQEWRLATWSVISS